MTPDELHTENERLNEAKPIEAALADYGRLIEENERLCTQNSGLRAEINRLHDELSRPTCDICGGVPMLGQTPCACGGSGRAEDALSYVRTELLKALSERDEARAQLAAALALIHEHGLAVNNTTDLGDALRQVIQAAIIQADNAKTAADSTKTAVRLMREARAQTARLAEALRDAIALGKHLSSQGKWTYHEKALVATDSLAWLNERIAEELERLHKTFECGMRTTTSPDMRLAWKRAIECCEDRIAELRRKEGE